MLPIQGIWKDSPLSKQPQGFAFDAFNAVIEEGVYKNESGCEIHSEEWSALNHQLIGKANLKYGDKLVFTIGDGTNHIGIIKADGSYINKLSFDLGFNEAYPLDVEIYYNFKGEVIAAFTDGLNTPKLINLDDIEDPFTINSIELFLKFKEPIIDSEVLETGGALVSGAYYPFFAFKKNDGSKTPYTRVGNPIFISDDTISEGFAQYDGVEAGTITSKAIQLNLTNVDTAYDKIVVGIVSKIDGVLTAKEIKEETISSDIYGTTITGNETSTTIDFLNLTTSSAVYDSIKHFTQVNGILYGAVVSEATALDFQKWANLIKLKWNSTLTTVRDLNQSHKIHAYNGKKRGFAHEEVYAFYIRLKIKGAGWTRGFLISGRAAEGIEASLNTTLTGSKPEVATDIAISNTSRYYQTRDTTGSNGKFGFWENQNELYPDTEDFAPVETSPGVFSEDLRGKKIRHHRFPSIRKCKETLYSGDGQYAVSKLDILGVEIDSFPTLPSDVSANIEGWEICYAKRNPGNSIVAGQSLTLMGSKRDSRTGDTKIYTTGGNWKNHEVGDGNKKGKKDKDEAYYPEQDRLRLHSFDLLLNKPALTPSYISSQIKMRYSLEAAHSWEEINLENGLSIWAFEVNYGRGAGVTTAYQVSQAQAIRKIKDFKYVPANTNSGDIQNFIGEEVAVAQIENGGLNLAVADNGMDLNDEDANSDLRFEETYLASIMQYKTDIYNTFYSQSLVTTGKYVLIGQSAGTIYGGDTFVGEFSFITIAPKNHHDFENPNAGVKAIRSFVCECYNNVGLRHEVSTNGFTRYYPKQPITNYETWFVNYGLENPNVLAYNKDYTSVNDLNLILPYNPFEEFVSSDPYKIIRCKIPNAEERTVSWRTFLANDYYIVRRDKGFITNIQGVGENLFINLENDLLKTRSSEELATDSFKVVLGTGNIFDRPPISVLIDEDGYAGCQHKHSCLLTRFGYFFVDEDRKKVFLVGDDPKDITAGLTDFFEEKLLTTEDNPYREKGYTVGWDEKYERIILSSFEANFTVSYYPKLGSWVSRHTYRPTIIMGDRNSLFAFSDNKIFKHNIPSKKGIYYNDDVNPFFLIPVFTADDSVTFANINWRTEFILNESERQDITFNQALLWNSYQSSGEVDLVPFKETLSLEDNFDGCNVRRVKKRWNLNRFRDVVTDRNLQFIDGVDIVGANITEDKDFESRKRLSDNFLVVKLLFSNEKISTLQGELRVLDIGVTYNIAKR